MLNESSEVFDTAGFEVTRQIGVNSYTRLADEERPILADLLSHRRFSEQDLVRELARRLHVGNKMLVSLGYAERGEVRIELLRDLAVYLGMDLGKLRELFGIVVKRRTELQEQIDQQVDTSIPGITRVDPRRGSIYIKQVSLIEGGAYFGDTSIQLLVNKRELVVFNNIDPRNVWLNMSALPDNPVAAMPLYAMLELAYAPIWCADRLIRSEEDDSSMFYWD